VSIHGEDFANSLASRVFLMNHAEAPTNDSDVLRLFHENDSLGAESSLFLRSARQLTKYGKPVGRNFVLTAPTDQERQMPFGILTLTPKGRLVFWPALPRLSCVITTHSFAVPDHITVEFPSERVHVTSYDDAGKSISSGDGWRSALVDRQDFRFLFSYMSRLSVIVDQDVLVSRKFETPASDDARRKIELEKFAADLIPLPVTFPAISKDSQYLYCGAFVAPEMVTSQDLPKSLFPNKGIGDTVRDWPCDSEFPINLAKIPIEIPVRKMSLYLAVAFPPGELIDEVAFGLPRRGQ
jgi:hypothetical protein